MQSRAKLRAERNKDCNEFLSKQQKEGHVEIETKDRNNSQFIQQLGAPPRERRVTFPQEWSEEGDMYGSVRHGPRGEMKIRETDRADQGVERRTRSHSPPNRNRPRSAPPERKELSLGGFMDGFGKGERGREEERKRKEVYGRELKEQIRKKVEFSVAQDAKRTPRSSCPLTPPTQRNQTEARSQFESPEKYQTPPRPDHSPSLDTVAHRREPRKKSREEPMGEWSPWGKGGAGAPLKDNSGRVVADRTILSKANQVRERTGNSPKLEALADISPLHTSREKQADQQQVRGSGGVSRPGGSGLTPQREYLEQLEQQMAENQARKRAEANRIREEDLREDERVQRDRLEMEEDDQRDKAKQREREERRRGNQVPPPHVPSPQEKRVRERRSSPDNTSPSATSTIPRRETPAESPVIIIIIITIIILMMPVWLYKIVL